MNIPSKKKIILITGIPASGKSTVAQQLAQEIPNSVHLRGDLFRRMIVNGRVDMDPEPTEVALEQLRLRYRIAAAAAREYFNAGFSVIYQDVILGELLKEVIGYYHKYPLHIVVLCPIPDVVAHRDADRAKRGYYAFSVDELDRVLRTETPHLGLWLDTTDLSVDETITRIIEDLETALVHHNDHSP